MKFNRDIKIVLFNSPEGKVLFKPFGYHKLLLAAFGLLLDGFEGLITGFIIGCIFDSRWVKNQAPPKNADLRLNTLMLGAFVLQTSGVELKLSPDTIRQRLIEKFGEEYVEKRFTFFRELLRQRIQVEAICDNMRKIISDKDKLSIIVFLYDLTVHSSANYEKLNAAVYYVAGRLDIDTNVFKETARKYTSGRPESNSSNGAYQKTDQKKNDHYSELGLQHNCDYRSLKKAYHELAKKYHPDTKPDISMTEKLKMQERFRSITEAYEKIKVERGWN